MTKFFRGFGYAWRGIVLGFRTQRNLQVHAAMAILAICMGFWLKVSLTEWCFIAFAIGLVISAELFNTAIEHLVDLVSPEWNEKAGKIKDIAAGAVLVCAIAALTVGLIIFLPKLVERF